MPLPLKRSLSLNRTGRAPSPFLIPCTENQQTTGSSRALQAASLLADNPFTSLNPNVPAAMSLLMESSSSSLRSPVSEKQPLKSLSGIGSREREWERERERGGVMEADVELGGKEDGMKLEDARRPSPYKSGKDVRFHASDSSPVDDCVTGHQHTHAARHDPLLTPCCVPSSLALCPTSSDLSHPISLPPTSLILSPFLRPLSSYLPSFDFSHPLAGFEPCR